MRLKKRFETGAARFLFALEQDRDVNGKGALGIHPGPAGLDEGHDLSFVVRSAARDDDLAMGGIVGEMRLEGRHRPSLQGVRRLHVVVAVKKHVRAGSAAICPTPSANHHRLSAGGFDPRVKTGFAQRVRTPACGLEAIVVIGRIGRDAGYGQELKQAL